MAVEFEVVTRRSRFDARRTRSGTEQDRFEQVQEVQTGKKKRSTVSESD
jgi:hypothetical protein